MIHNGYKIALTSGCPAGIGPEICHKALQQISLPQGYEIIRCDDGNTSKTPGKVSTDDLLYQHASLMHAIELAKQGEVDAIVTGPTRKIALNGFFGQTEMLHHYLAVDDEEPLMCFAGGPFILGLATVHVPLKDTSKLITPQRIQTCLRRLQEACTLFPPPAGGKGMKGEGESKDAETIHLAVLGLNPHAGEGGFLGNEEQHILIPVMRQWRRDPKLLIDGPLPADGFFGNLHRQSKDQLPHAVLAMTHDQGLAPYKILAAEKTVNFTMGLRLPRTSPGGGTADEIAGRNCADPRSMIAAIQLAIRFLKKRRNTEITHAQFDTSCA